jgi:hypothetical protein
MAFATLGDLRDLVELHLPAEHRARNTWHIAKLPDLLRRKD